MVGLTAAGVGACTRRATEEATLYLNWIFTGSFAGEAVAAKNSKTQGFPLVVRQGGQGLDPLRLVKDGDFGMAAFDELLRANENGADFVILGAANEQTPAVFAALTKSGIRAPQDFVGRRVGVLPFGSTGLVYQAMLTAAKVDRSRIVEVVVSPDLRTFISGATHDVQPIFAYDETITLETQNVAYNLIKPADYGVRFVGPCYFTTAATLSRQRRRCERFVRLLASSWAEAARAPQGAIAALADLDPRIDKVRELKVLQRGLPYFVDGVRPPLRLDRDAFASTVQTLVQLKVLKQPPSADVAAVAFEVSP